MTRQIRDLIKKFNIIVSGSVFFFDATNNSVVNFYKEYNEISDNFFDNVLPTQLHVFINEYLKAKFNWGVGYSKVNFLYKAYKTPINIIVKSGNEKTTGIIKNIIYRYIPYLSVSAISLYLLLNL